MRHEKRPEGTTIRSPRYSRRKSFIIDVVILLILATVLGGGVGVGLVLHRRRAGDEFSAGSAPSTTTPAPSPNATPSDIWQPESGVSWNYQLKYPLSSPETNNTDVWDIDLFDNSQAIISGLQSRGSKVICYFSAGSYEDWRPDASKFRSSDMGKELDGWPGEKWLDINSDSVRSIMSARMDLAVQKGCNGVDPDNVDGYNNDNGLGLTQEDSINYLQFLAAAAQPRNLSIGLKNAGEILTDVIDLMQWSVNEQCFEYDECETYQPFISQGKPVFHVEYPKGDSNTDLPVAPRVKEKICDDVSAAGFSTVIKNIDLDAWTERCS